MSSGTFYLSQHFFSIVVKPTSSAYQLLFHLSQLFFNYCLIALFCCFTLLGCKERGGGEDNNLFRGMRICSPAPKARALRIFTNNHTPVHGLAAITPEH